MLRATAEKSYSLPKFFDRVCDVLNRDCLVINVTQRYGLVQYVVSLVPADRLVEDGARTLIRIPIVVAIRPW